MINFKTKSHTVMVFFALAAIAFIILSPFLILWAMNTLFPTFAIPYTFETWCAIVLIGVFLRGDGIKFNEKQ